MAVKITTADCCDPDIYISPQAYENGIYHRYILEVEDSPWIKELKKQVSESQEDLLKVLDNCYHYILLLEEDVVEIVVYDNYDLKIVELSQQERERLNSQRIYLSNQ